MLEGPQGAQVYRQIGPLPSRDAILRISYRSMEPWTYIIRFSAAVTRAPTNAPYKNQESDFGR